MADGQLLPSWNDGATKSAILDLVARVTKQGSAEFVPPAGRVATFDNDGTLWREQPLQIQFFFAFDRVKQLSAKDPTMSERHPFKAVLEHDCNTLFGLGEMRLSPVFMARDSATPPPTRRKPASAGGGWDSKGDNLRTAGTSRQGL